MASQRRTALLLAGVTLGFMGGLSLALSRFVTMAELHHVQVMARAYYLDHPWQMALFFCLAYFIAGGLAIPGSYLLTIMAGAVFDFVLAVFMVPFAITCGASLSFLISRFMLRRHIERLFPHKLSEISEGVKKDGSYYLLSLRLVPLIPFVLINLLMGLTPMRLGPYFLISLVGILPRTIAYLNAGAQLGEVTSLQGILSFRVIAAFMVIGLLPLVLKVIIQHVKVQGSNHSNQSW
jgi:uncharacterized membrane protein YdjX (TVP38/TMEM64 family)